MADREIRFKAAVPDVSGSIAFILDQKPVLSASNTHLLSIRNNGTEYVRVDKVGKTILGGTPGAYTPTGGLCVNSTLIQLGDGSGNIGLDLRSGAAGAYISDASVFWQYFLKSPSRVEFPVKLVFSNNVGIIETSQANGGAGSGSPGFKITALNSLTTSGDRLLSLVNVASEKFYVEWDGTVYAGALNSPSAFTSREDDGATAKAFILDTVNTLSTAGSRLLTIRNATQEIISYGVGVNGYTFFSNALGNPSVAAFVLDAKNTLVSAPDTSILEFRHIAALQSSIDPYGNYTSEDGLNLYTKGSDVDPGFASGVATIVDNTFDTGDTLNIVVQGRGTFGFIETTDFAIGGSASATATNLAAAINARAICNTLVSANAVGAAVTITARFPGSIGNKIHLYKIDGATVNFTLSGLSPNNRFTGGADSGLGLVLDTGLVLTNDPQRRLLSLRNGQQEKLHVSPAGGLGVGSKGTAVSVSSTGETIIGVTDTSIARTVTLDSDDEVNGRVVIVKDESGAAGTNNITIDTEGASTIDGAASVPITANYGVLRLYFRNGNWFSF